MMKVIVEVTQLQENFVLLRLCRLEMLLVWPLEELPVYVDIGDKLIFDIRVANKERHNKVRSIALQKAKKP